MWLNALQTMLNHSIEHIVYFEYTKRRWHGRIVSIALLARRCGFSSGCWALSVCHRTEAQLVCPKPCSNLPGAGRNAKSKAWNLSSDVLRCSHIDFGFQTNVFLCIFGQLWLDYQNTSKIKTIMLYSTSDLQLIARSQLIEEGLSKWKILCTLRLQQKDRRNERW